MRPSVAYAVAMTVVASCMAGFWAIREVLEDAASQRPLTGVEQWLISIATWAHRSVPFVVVSATFTVVPLLTWLAPRALRRSFSHAVRPQAALPYLVIALGSWAAFILGFPDGPWMTLALWSGSVAGGVTIAVAVLAQEDLNQSGRSDTAARSLLLTGVALQLGAFVTTPAILGIWLVPAVATWRSEGRRPTSASS